MISEHPGINLPKLAIISIGNNEESLKFISMNLKMLKSHNIDHHFVSLSEELSVEDIKREIEVYNKCPETCGILLQLPLPPKFKSHGNEIVNTISSNNITVI